MVRAGHAAQAGWDALGGEARARLLDRAADLYEEHREEFFSLCIREAGKTLLDAVLEVREAVDFLRFYASEARRQFTRPLPLPGPDRRAERAAPARPRRVRLHSPVEFPAGDLHRPVAAALAAGNAVDRQARRADAADRRARGRADAPGGHSQGRGPARARRRAGSAAALTAHPLLAGVAFTGSTDTARMINRTLAERDGPIIPFIAETGGQNAMIVDSSALPEQVTRDVMSSAFQSAGQRCSALRVLFVQEDVADGMIAMIAGAMEALKVGDPSELATDVGPVIDEPRPRRRSTSTSTGSTRTPGGSAAWSCRTRRSARLLRRSGAL